MRFFCRQARPLHRANQHHPELDGRIQSLDAGPGGPGKQFYVLLRFDAKAMDKL